MKFSDKLVGWYHQHQRNLPWRNTNDAYKIWVSEVILQQTRVEQGLDYYERIIEKYPDVFKLASAKEDELLKLWQGLGYYSRARNMLSAAKEIVAEYNGVFPDIFDEMIQIKGIGKYTASAILSFAYELPYSVLDGNVKRILSRYYGITGDVRSSATEREFVKKLNKLFDKKRSSDFNQAIMDFGALQCKIKALDCSNCLFNDKCKAFLNGMVATLPVVSKRTKVKIRYFYYMVPKIIIKGKFYTYLEKRESEDIWKHLFQFPLIETKKELAMRDLLNTNEFRELINNNSFEISSFSGKYSHKLSHQTIRAVFVQLIIKEEVKDKKWIRILINDLKKYPVSRLTEKYLNVNFFQA